MAKLFILVLGFVGISILLLSVGVLLRKDGKFRSQDVGQSKAMRQRGIDCTRSQDKKAQADRSSIFDMMK